MSKNNDIIWVIERVNIHLNPQQWRLADMLPYECRELARMKAKKLREDSPAWYRYRVSKYIRSKSR